MYLHDTSGHDNHDALSQVLVTVFSDKILIQYEKRVSILPVRSATCPPPHPTSSPLNIWSLLTRVTAQCFPVFSFSRFISFICEL